MSSKDLAVSVRGLSKSYTIAHNAPKHTMVGEALMHRLKNPFQRAEKETFWALKDVEFDIQKGDVVGIIGRNGAGKSTLLKILSRITKPTTGQIDLYGRVGSLLEVGTGFHPELTGRENVFLNGAILGMRKREIERQFDAIVEFAEVEQFLDTPVKRYSSGMYVRLAFAVAAHLNPEILIVDEVLSVGDGEFQKKCLGKMQDVAESGRTVLFVSHSMAAVKRLCSHAILLQKGRLLSLGLTDAVVDDYISQGHTEQSEVIWDAHDSGAGDESLSLQSVALKNQAGLAVSEFDFLEPILLEVRYQVQKPGRTRLIVWVHNDDGVLMFVSRENESTPDLSVKASGNHISTCSIPGHLLNNDHYFVTLLADVPNEKLIFKHENLVSFRICASSGIASQRDEGDYGVICPPIEWMSAVQSPQAQLV